MKGYRPERSFADEVSARFHDSRGDEDDCIAFLKPLAGRGPVLELAIGTGRIALPLASSGLRVDGIDFSPAMVERLRAKPGGKALAVQIANFRDLDLPDRYQLIFIVWNSFFNLLTQEDQLLCFANVAKHLTDTGLFVIEAFVPAFLHRLDEHRQVRAETIDADSVCIGLLRHDPTRQRLEQNHVTLSAAGTRLDPVVQRYAWPSELDLMARLAGLRLRKRQGGWHGEPWNAHSSRHVSVYGPAAS